MEIIKIIGQFDRVDVRVGATGAIAPADFQKWQIASINFELAEVKCNKITQKNWTFKAFQSPQYYPELLDNTAKTLDFLKNETSF